MRGEHATEVKARERRSGSSPRARGALPRTPSAYRTPRIIPACAGSTLPCPMRRKPQRDHPRVRGEHCVSPSTARTARGSSPRARGAPLHGLENRRESGIIPACAGSTLRRPSRPSSSRDHPRVRGEHENAPDGVVAAQGSSPRARGARRVSALVAGYVGIIPACAGSTTVAHPAHWRVRDHPRVRGEHWVVGPARDADGGSSPRARGAPTRSGTTSPPARDHPRVRGEHYDRVYLNNWPEGSSPRARGAPGDSYLHGYRRGIIPACAGSTTSPTPTSPSPWDHPRVRGEHATSTVMTKATGGSSPRARGAPTDRTHRGPLLGIIPACAGSTGRHSRDTMASRDHPRVRGEHRSPPPARAGQQGSSPRARGAPGPHPRPGRDPGIIPACAGSTNRGTCRSCDRWDHPRVRGEHS